MVWPYDLPTPIVSAISRAFRPAYDLPKLAPGGGFVWVLEGLGWCRATQPPNPSLFALFSLGGEVVFVWATRDPSQWWSHQPKKSLHNRFWGRLGLLGLTRIARFPKIDLRNPIIAIIDFESQFLKSEQSEPVPKNEHYSVLFFGSVNFRLGLQ